METKTAVNEAFYLPPSGELWTGRTTDPKSGNQYWYQEIKLIDRNDLQNMSALSKAIALVGYACDEGVVRNYGRSGSVSGPNEIRKSLAKLPVHFSDKQILDLGNVICNDGNLEETQEYFGNIINSLLRRNIFPIAIGGGHDIAYGHFCGIRNYISVYSDMKVAIINLDAHFDLRPIEKKATSGTPFNQIFKELDTEGLLDYVVLGIQQQANTKELFAIADKLNVSYLLNYECEVNNIEAVKRVLQPIIDRNDYIYLTIDMDGFSSAYAPGVSAPSPLGFTPYFALNILSFILQTGKVISCDIAELNPDYDKDETTSRLVARLIDYIVWQLSN